MKAKPWENSKQFTYLYGHDAIEYALQNDLQVTVIPNDLMDQGGVLRICDSSEHLEKAKEIADANGSIAVIRYATMAANWFHKFYERKDIPDSQPEMISFGKDKLNNVDEINVSFFHDSREKHERYQFPDGSAIIIRNDFSWGQGGTHRQLPRRQRSAMHPPLERFAPTTQNASEINPKESQEFL